MRSLLRGAVRNRGLRRARALASESLELLAYRLGCLLARFVPLPLQQAALARFAHLLIELGERRARWALVNLSIAYPELDPRALRDLARRSHAQLAWNVLDYLRMGAWSAEDVRSRVELVGLENLRAALARGRGAILVVPHMGNFELALQALALSGIDCAAIVRSPRNRWLAPELARLRARHGVEIIERRGALRRSMDALRKGKTVVVTLDQARRGARGILVPLFGLRVPTSGAIARIALRSGAPLVPSGVIREGPDRHRGLILGPIDCAPSGERAKDVELLTYRCTATMEALIRSHPEHWMWTYRRFRHSPDLEGDPYE